MDGILPPQTVARSMHRGLRSAVPDEDLSRLGAAFHQLDGALLAGGAVPGLLDEWWAVVRDATQLRATAARGRRIKARMLLAVIRQTGSSVQACDLAQSVANDLTGRVGRKKKPMPPTEGMIKYFTELGLSRRAARVLTRLGCQNAHAVLRFNPECFGAQANCGRATIAELRTFVVERRRLQNESSLSIHKG